LPQVMTGDLKAECRITKTGCVEVPAHAAIVAPLARARPLAVARSGLSYARPDCISMWR
jgi:hypothetical protein